MDKFSTIIEPSIESSLLQVIIDITMDRTKSVIFRQTELGLDVRIHNDEYSEAIDYVIEAVDDTVMNDKELARRLKNMKKELEN